MKSTTKKTNKIICLLAIIFSISLQGCQKENNNYDLILEEASEKLTIPKETSNDLLLPTNMIINNKEINIIWSSSDTNIIDPFGKVTTDIFTHEIELIAEMYIDSYSQKKSFLVLVHNNINVRYEIEKALNKKCEFLNKIIENDVTLPSIISLENNNIWYDFNVSWSSNDIVIKNNLIKKILTKQKGNVMASIKINNEVLDYIYPVVVIGDILVKENNFHQIFETPKNWNKETTVGLNIIDSGLVLEDGLLEGTYYSDIIENNNILSMVGSWSSKTTKDSSVELLVSLKIDDKWSSFVSYGKWGIDQSNASDSRTTNDRLIKINTDEIIIQNNKIADAFCYKIILRRKSNDILSPVMKMVSFAIQKKDYVYKIDSILPDYVIYDVPKLYQRAVPTIGGNICSPTSITMLMNYLGYHFNDELEHRYVANQVYDSGDNIYGNWSYNVAFLGSKEKLAYVGRMYSLDELKEYLTLVGPLALSVKGNMQGLYTTNGHLLVVKGYKIINNQLVFICNDPALSYVEVEYSSDTIQKVWRNIAYCFYLNNN